MRGLEAKHEHAARKVARDTRPLGTRVAEFISNPTALISIATAGVMVSFLYPIAADITFLVILSIFYLCAF